MTTRTTELMQPIDTIPPEILAEIFSALLPQGEDASIAPDVAPLLVSHVSRKWRDIALTTSLLWSSFKIIITTSTKPHRLSIVNLWIQRSSCQPLSLTVWMDPFAHLKHDICDTATSIFRLLAAHSTRWRRVSLVLPGSNHLFGTLCTCAAPNLQSASFKLGNWTAEEAWDINNLLRRAPAIRSLVWSNRSSWGAWDVPFDSGLERLQISWHGLTDVVLDTWVTLKTALDILGQCSCLAKLELRHFSSNPELVVDLEDTPLDDKYSSASPLRLNHLESLDIYQLKLDDGLGGLLDRLLCPSLQHFNFSCGFVEAVPWPQSAFHNFIVRSHAALCSLFLEFTGINETQLTQCLQTSSATLTRLELYDARGDICVGDELLDMLRFSDNASGQAQVLCPKLQTLVIHRVVQCTDGALASMLQSRMPPACISSEVANDEQEVVTCVPLQHVDALFSKRYQTQNSIDMEYLRKVPAISNSSAL